MIPSKTEMDAIQADNARIKASGKLPRTAQQSNFISAVLDGRRAGGGRNFCLRARAGTGKSATILELVDDYAREFPGDEVALCAFGNKASSELKEKLERRGHTNWRTIAASTIHSLGFGLVKFAFKLTKDNINEHKVRDLIDAQNGPAYAQHGYLIKQLVEYAKQEGFGFFPDVQIGDTHAWYRIADHYDINGFDDTSDLDEVVRAAQHIYRLSLADTKSVDFADMILFPLVKNLRVKFQKRLLVVDEAQDTGRARQALLMKFLARDGIMIVVGDDKQGIFGFAGAQADALEQLVRALRAEVLPLTVTWRCPAAVVREAQRLVPDIEAAPGAVEGEVLRLAAIPAKAELRPTDAILCRNTAPLVEQAYKLLRDGVACKVEGREIGTGLVRLLQRWKTVKTIAAYLDRLEDYQAREVQKAMAKGNEGKAAEVVDRCETLRHICRAVQDRKQTQIADAVAFVEAMFAEDVTKSGVLTLCTYHRSKGREWPRVYLLEHNKRCPSPWAKQDWQKSQEDNLAYVAITRAQQTLAYVS